MKKLLLSCVIALLAVPAFAVEFTSGDFKANIYGNIYADGFYTYSYSSDKAEPLFSSLSMSNGKHSFGSYAFVGSSNFGVTMSYQNVSGTIEAGLGDPVRKFYLKYNIGGRADHYILAGRDNNIAFYNYGQMSNDGQCMIDYGTLANKRRLQLRYGISGFEMAIIIPQIGFGSGDDKAYTDSFGYSYTENNGNNVDDTIKSSDYMFNYLPRLELAYTITQDTFNFKVFGSYGAYMYYNNSASANIDSFNKTAHMFYIGFGGQANIGNSFLNYVGYFGQNMYLNNAQGDYRTGFSKSALNPISLVSSNGKYTIDINDIYSAGGSLGYGYSALDGKLVSQIGIGYSASFADHYVNADQNIGAFLNTQYFVTDWFSIIPEIALLYNIDGANGENQGFSIVAGLVFALNF